MKYFILLCTVAFSCLCSYAQFVPIHPDGLHSITYDDMNGDGMKDLVGLESTTEDILLFIASAGNVFENPVNLSSGNGPDTHLAVEDLDLDGDLDLIMSGGGFYPTSVSVFLNDGTGVFSSSSFDINDHLPVSWPPNDGIICLVYEAEFLDLNDDSAPDFFVTMTNCMGTGQYEMLTLGIAGNGAGGFDAGHITSSFHQAPSNGVTITEQIDKADLDADGMEEFLILEDADAIWEAQGVFGFLPNGVTQYLLNSGVDYYRFRLIDHDLNGYTDLVLLSDDDLHIFYADATGIASAGESLFVPDLPLIDFDMGYVNSDGYVDIVGVDQEGELVIYAGDAQGNFNFVAGIDQTDPNYQRIELFEADAFNPMRILVSGQGGTDFFQYTDIGTITGLVYLDLDGDQSYSSGDYEIPGLILQIDNGTMYTSQNSEFLHYLTYGNYTLSLIGLDESDWTLITPDSFDFTLDASTPNVSGLEYGLMVNIPNESLVPSINTPKARCNTTRNHTVSVFNDGNQFLDGTVRYKLDSLCTLISSVAADSLDLDANIVYFSFDSLAPNQSMNFLVTMIYPGSDFIGASLLHQVETTYGNNNVASAEDLQILACAYDPNDKTEFNGWREPGYIPNTAGTELDYLIRFQNTGTDTAFQVIISDFLHSSIDVSTLSVIASSHEHTVQSDINGNSLFIFEDILLVDSVTNEPESHGFVRFRVALKDSVPAGTMIPNSAAIIFDQNPPILTNSTMNTTVVCDSLGHIMTDSIPEILCAESTLTLHIDTFLVQQTSWTVDGEPLGEGPFIDFSESMAGTYELVAVSSSPICNMSSTAIVSVGELPTATITQQFGYLLECITAENNEIQWLFEGVAIPDENETLLYIDQSGLYQVMVTDSNGCEGFSDILNVVYSSLDELGLDPILLSPNPSSGHITIRGRQLPENARLEVYSLSGALALVFPSVRMEEQLNLSELDNGIYEARLMDSKGQIITRAKVTLQK